MPKPLQNYTTQIAEMAKVLPIEEVIKNLTEEFPGQITFSTSFSFEDQVITHQILGNQLPVKIFTLDTGRRFSETYSVCSATNENYQTQIKAYYPGNSLLEPFIEEKGPNSFYESVENRKECCYIRKVEPLKRALQGYSIWITGIRAEQSEGRKDVPSVEWDEANNIIKFHPLLNWTLDEVKQYIAKRNIPYNSLHDK